MTWRSKPPLVRILKGVAAALPVAILTVFAPPAHANWGEMAMVSETMGISDSRICIGEGSRGDLGCPSYAPTISPTGRINASAGLTVDSVSLTTTGMTWGYLGSGASYLPNLSSNAISATNISASTINGISVTALGGGASPTNVPAFRANKGGSAQTISANTWAKLTFSGEDFDTYGNFDTATSRFTPTVAGTYLFAGSSICFQGSGGYCYTTIYKNGVNLAMAGGNNTAATTDQTVPVSTLVYMNGTTDYVELFTYQNSTNVIANSNQVYFSGSLLASGNGLVSGTGATALSGLTDVTLTSPATGQVLTYNGTRWVNATPSATTVISGTTSMVSGWPDAIVCNITAPAGALVAKKVLPLVAQNDSITVYAEAYAYSSLNGNAPSDFVFNTVGKTFNQARGYTASDCHSKSISTLYAEGKAFNFIGNSGLGTALGDRLTSGTLSVTANSSTAIISLTTNGTTWGYLGSTASYIPTINTSAISATVVQISSNTAVTCGAGNAGTLRYNNSNTALELCTGTSWQMMGVGIPAGTISAFASTTCPTGWSEYTAARGRFLRGIDNGAGNDPSGTRVPGGVQGDDFKSHKHNLERLWSDSTGSPNGLGTANSILKSVTANQDYGTDPRGLGIAVGTGSGGSGYMTDALRDTGGNETRPKNVAVTFCQFNGTSNGWNNPLSGGSTVPGGSTGQIQYNTSGSFDASAGLTWNNAASRLTATNISATSLTVNGVAITGSSSSDRITSGTTSMVANPSGTIEVNGGIRLISATTAPVCSAATAGTIARINGKTFECRM